MAVPILDLSKSLRCGLSSFSSSDLSPLECAVLAEDLGATEKACVAVRLLAASKAASNGVHKKRGFSSPSDWMARHGGSTGSQARRGLETASKLGKLPATREAAISGDISMEQALEIVNREAEAPGSETELLAVAKASDLTGLRDKVRQDRQAGEDPDELRRRQKGLRRFRHWTDDLGMIAISVLLTPEVGIPFVKRVERETHRLRQKRKAAGLKRQSFETDAADAFVLIVNGEEEASSDDAAVNDSSSPEDARADGARTDGARTDGARADGARAGGAGERERRPGGPADPAAPDGTGLGDDGASPGDWADDDGGGPDDDASPDDGEDDGPGGSGWPGGNAGLGDETDDGSRGAGQRCDGASAGDGPNDASRGSGLPGDSACAGDGRLFDTPGEPSDETQGSSGDVVRGEPSDVAPGTKSRGAGSSGATPGPFPVTAPAGLGSKAPAGAAGAAPAPGAEASKRPEKTTPNKPPARVVDLVIVCDLNAWRRGYGLKGEPVHIVGGGPIPVSLAKELSEDAFLKAVIHDGVNIHTVKHFGRYMPVVLRTALDLGKPPDFVGRRCTECGKAYGLQTDHIDPVAHNGPTSYDNSQSLCFHCHQDKTERDRKAGLLYKRPP